MLSPVVVLMRGSQVANTNTARCEPGATTILQFMRGAEDT